MFRTLYSGLKDQKIKVKLTVVITRSYTLKQVHTHAMVSPRRGHAPHEIFYLNYAQRHLCIYWFWHDYPVNESANEEAKIEQNVLKTAILWPSSCTSIFVNFVKHCLTGKYISELSFQQLWDHCSCESSIQYNSYVNYLLVQFYVRKLPRLWVLLPFNEHSITYKYN